MEIFKIALGNELGAAITPTAMGGGPIKLGMLISAGLSPAQALSINLLGSLEDATFFLLALPAAFIFSRVWLVPAIKELFNHIYQLGSWLILIAIAVMILLLIFLTVGQKIKKISLPNGDPWFTNIIAKIKKNYQDICIIFKLIGRKGKYLFWGNVGLCAVQWISRYSILTILLKSLNITVDAVLFFALQWIVFTLMNFFPTPGAVGGAEASFMIVHQELIPSSIMSTALTGWRFLTFYFLLITASIFFLILEFHSWRVKKSAAGLSGNIPHQKDNRTIVPEQSPELINDLNT